MPYSYHYKLHSMSEVGALLRPCSQSAASAPSHWIPFQVPVKHKQKASLPPDCLFYNRNKLLMKKALLSFICILTYLNKTSFCPQHSSILVWGGGRGIIITNSVSPSSCTPRGRSPGLTTRSWPSFASFAMLHMVNPTLRMVNWCLSLPEPQTPAAHGEMREDPRHLTNSLSCSTREEQC